MHGWFWVLTIASSFTVSNFVRSDDSIPLLKRSDRTIRCCPEGTKGARCLERLARAATNSPEKAACLVIASQNAVSEYFAPNNSCTGNNALGIATDDYGSHGWWGKSPPQAQSLTWYPPESVAAQSEGCKSFEADGVSASLWEQKRAECAKRGYDSVHLYVSTSADFDIPAKNYSTDDPWQKSPISKDKVWPPIHVRSGAELQKEIAKLVMDCKLISFAGIVAHGTPGVIWFNNEIAYPTTQVFSKLIAPCALAPDAKIEILSCLQGCRQAVEPLRSGLQKIFADKIYTTAGGKSPFPELKILFNTDFGLVGPAFRFPLTNTLKEHLRTTMQTFSANDLGIEFNLDIDRWGKTIVKTDVPSELVPLCPIEFFNQILTQVPWHLDMPELTDPTLPLRTIHKR